MDVDDDGMTSTSKKPESWPDKLQRSAVCRLPVELGWFFVASIAQAVVGY